MPKKLHTNPKAQEARERKDEQKKVKRAAEVKAAQDEYWKDEGQSAAEKRAAAAEAKRLEEAKKREQKRLLAEKEEKEMQTVRLAKEAKVTQFQLTQRAIKLEKEKEELDKIKQMKEQNLIPQLELEETINMNRLRSEIELKELEEFGAGNVVSASSLEEALEALKINGIGNTNSLLSSTGGGEEKLDRRPEKRMKAAYLEFEEREMPNIKEENPGLRLSQYKELLWKLWLKSPENPINIAAMQKAQAAAAAGK